MSADCSGYLRCFTCILSLYVTDPLPRAPPKLIIHPSHISVYFRQFALCSVEFTELHLLCGTGLCQGCEQDCKQTLLLSNRRFTELAPFFAQLKILGSSRTPFAVKGGGHSTYPGFSSTPGVQIALSRLNSTKVNINDATVEIGPGLTWEQVYQTLGPSGVNVIGGRTPSVGISGSTLGGGGCHADSRIIRWALISNPYRIFIQVESIWTHY